MRFSDIFVWRIKKATIENDRSFQEFSDYVQNFDYSQVSDEDYLLEYAKDKYSETKQTAEYVDDKADALIKYLGLGTGGVGAFLGLSFGEIVCLPQIISLCIGILGGFIWAAAVIMALQIRNPAEMPFPSKLDVLINVMKETKSKRITKIATMLAYQKASIGQSVVGRIKGERLQLAFTLTMLAFILFLCSFFLNFVF